MKKSLILVNILALFLTSCSNFRSSESERLPAAASGGESCTDIAQNIIGNAKAQSYEEKIKASVKLDLTAEELSDYMIAFNDTNMDPTYASTVRSIMLYGKEDAGVRKDLLKEFNNQIHGRGVDETNVNWKKFAAHKKKVDSKKLKMKTPEKAEIYEKLYYSCKTQIKGTPTPEAIRQSKRLTYALMAGGLSATTASYVGVHWEEEKNQKWFNELYFTLGIGIVFSFIGSKLVLANPKLDPWKGKMPLAFLNNALSDAGVSGVYYFMFRTKDSELQKKLDDLEKDPEAQKKLQELMVIAEENHLFEKHQKTIQDMFKDKKTGKSVEARDFDHEITMDDVDLEGSRDVLLEALAEQEYQENSGLMKTGYPAVDRFSYHRIYNLLSVPTNIGMTILMHNQMCMTEEPKKGFMKAVGLYMGASLLMDALYFKGKKELINQ